MKTPRGPRSAGSAKYPPTRLRHLRGILKRPPGEKPFAEEMAEYKRAEKELEVEKLRLS